MKSIRCRKHTSLIGRVSPFCRFGMDSSLVRACQVMTAVNPGSMSFFPEKENFSSPMEKLTVVLWYLQLYETVPMK